MNYHELLGRIEGIVISAKSFGDSLYNRDLILDELDNLILEANKEES